MGSVAIKSLFEALFLVVRDHAASRSESLIFNDPELHGHTFASTRALRREEKRRKELADD